MSCITSSQEGHASVWTESTVNQIAWLTPFYACHGMDKARATLKRKLVTASAGTMNFQVVIQTAALRVTEPDEPVLIDQEVTGVGERCTGNLNISTTDKFYARFGVAYKMSQAGSGRADVYFQICLESFGKVAASINTLVVPPDETAYFLPVTGWMPALSFAKAKAIFAVTDSNSNFKYRLAVQTATTSVENPNAWASLEASWHTGNGEVTVGEQTVSTSDMWVRLGIMYTNATGTTNNPGQVSCVIAIRK